jgi:hypothetical protein
MGKSKHIKNHDYYADREYMDGGRYNDVDRMANIARLKEKKIERAVKTKNIDVLIDMDNEGLDPTDYEYSQQDNLNL